MGLFKRIKECAAKGRCLTSLLHTLLYFNVSGTSKVLKSVLNSE